MIKDIRNSDDICFCQGCTNDRASARAYFIEGYTLPIGLAVVVLGCLLAVCDPFIQAWANSIM